MTIPVFEALGRARVMNGALCNAVENSVAVLFIFCIVNPVVGHGEAVWILGSGIIYFPFFKHPVIGFIGNSRQSDVGVDRDNIRTSIVTANTTGPPVDID